MNESRRCPQCGASLAADAPEGLCPQCLIEQAQGGSAATSSYPGGFAAPSPAELAPHFPQLEILELLGQGGMGAVYRARQPGLDRLVALKILPPEAGKDPAFAERFTREARALARLNHPNIVGIHDVGRAGEFYYFVMEYVDGANLRHLLRQGRLSPEQALKIVPEICAALQYAHDEGIVHRDVKPENILLSQKGRVKIADFGLAKLLGRPLADARLTGTHQVMGTPHYMAPEQIEKPQLVDHRADIYSLGVVFYEMLTGELPLGRFAPPSHKVQVDVRLDEVVLRALEKEPERRYQHISDVKTDVESLAGVLSAPKGKAAPGNPSSAAVASGDAGQLEQLVLSFLPEEKIAAIKAYRERTGAGLKEAKEAVEAIASKHGISFPPVPPVPLWKWLVTLLGIVLVLFICLNLSEVVTYPLVFLLGVMPLAVMSWRFHGTDRGHLAASCMGVILWFMIGVPVLNWFANPEPVLNWLYARTGVTPGRFDVAFLKTLYFVVILGLVLWPLWLLDKQRTAAGRTTDHRGQEGPIPSGWFSLAKSPAIWAVLVCVLGVGVGFLPWSWHRYYGVEIGGPDPLTTKWIEDTKDAFAMPQWHGLTGTGTFLGIGLVALATAIIQRLVIARTLTLLLGGGVLFAIAMHFVVFAEREEYSWTHLIAHGSMPGPFVVAGLAIGLLILGLIDVRIILAERGEKRRQAASVSSEQEGSSAAKLVAPPRPGSPVVEPVSAEKLQGPANGLILAALAILLSAAAIGLWCGWTLTRIANVPNAPETKSSGITKVTITPKLDHFPSPITLWAILAGQVIVGAVGTVILLAGVMMKRLEHYSFAQWGAILALLPVSPAWLISLPAGLWALLALRRASVRAAFDQSVHTQEGEPAGAFGAWLASSAGWSVLMCLAGALATFLPWAALDVFGYQETQAGFDTWYGIVTGTAFAVGFLLLAALDLFQVARPTRGWAMAAVGALAIGLTTWHLVAILQGLQITSRETSGSPIIADLMQGMLESMLGQIRVRPLAGLFVALGLGIGLFGLGLVSLRRPRQEAIVLPPEQQVTAPAIGLLVAGILSCFLFVVLLSIYAHLARAADPPQPPPQTVQAGEVPMPVEATTSLLPNFSMLILMVQVLLTPITGLLMIAGAIQMLRLRSYRLATVACVIAMVPVTIVWLLGLPIGIWALRVLRRPQVQEAFRRRQEGIPAGSTA